MRDLTLMVHDMSCRHCVRQVTARLRDVPGVTTVVANMSTSTVQLTGSMTDADVMAAFGGTTFIAQIQ